MAAARKISRLAVANPAIPPSAETYVGAHDETQDTHREGMPFGTRGGLRVTHHFPVDGEYEIRIRLERSQRDDVRGLHEPHELELAVDGGRVRLFALDGGPAPVPAGGLRRRDARADGRRPPGAARAADRRSARRHGDVPGPELRRVREPLEAAAPKLPHAELGGRAAGGEPHHRDRPAGRRGPRRHPDPPAHLHLPARRCRSRRGGLRRADPRGACAARLPRAGDGRRRAGARRLLRGGARGRAGSRPASRRRCGGCWPVPSSSSASSSIRRTQRRAPPTASATWSWPRASRSSCGAAFPTSGCWRRPSAASCAAPARWSGRCAGCWPTRARRRWWTTSRASGSTCATCSTSSPSRGASATSTTTCGGRSGARRSCCSHPSSPRTAACWSCWTPTTRSSTSGSPGTTASRACGGATSGASR